MSKIEITTSTNSYDIFIEKDAILRLSAYVKNKTAVVIDSKVYSHHKDYILTSLDSMHLDYHIILVDGGESNKNIDNVLYMYSEFHNIGITKSDIIVCIGGGVIGDMTAFAAATYLRGVDIIQVPTTLLSMVDSSIGGKSAIDMPFGKNLVGVIKAPLGVLIDTRFLSSLDKRQFSTGMAEIIKSGLIGDGSILDEAMRDEMDIDLLIEKSLHVKGNIVMRDEFESGERMLLNLGHTVAHAIEALGEYTKYTHGEAVSIGTYYALKISENVLHMDSKITDMVVKLFDKFNLPYTNIYSTDELLKYIMTDKKMRGKIINFILVRGVGDTIIKPFELDELRVLLDEAKRG